MRWDYKGLMKLICGIIVAVALGAAAGVLLFGWIWSRK
jgi:hypothetical protein